MTDRPTLSILIPALAARRFRFFPLIDDLQAQARAAGDVEVLVLEDEGETPSGAKRNQLIATSRGHYFAQVDDDDFVAPDYVETIRDACDGRVEVVSFDLLRIDVERGNMRTHSFSIHNLDKVARSRGHWQMTANHLCAWRRDVGTKVAFPPAIGYADDCFWYKPLIESGLVRTETHLNRILYFYLYGSAATANQAADSIKTTRQWQGGGVECFRRGEEIFIANKPIEQSESEAAVEVRDRFGRVVTLDRKTLTRFTVIKV